MPTATSAPGDTAFMADHIAGPVDQIKHFPGIGGNWMI